MILELMILVGFIECELDKVGFVECELDKVGFVECELYN